METGSNWARDRFFKKGQAMLDGRQADAIINVCQRLIGHRTEEALVEALRPLLQPAYPQLGVPFGKSPSSPRNRLLGQ